MYCSFKFSVLYNGNNSLPFVSFLFFFFFIFLRTGLNIMKSHYFKVFLYKKRVWILRSPAFPTKVNVNGIFQVKIAQVVKAMPISSVLMSRGDVTNDTPSTG